MLFPSPVIAGALSPDVDALPVLGAVGSDCSLLPLSHHFLCKLLPLRRPTIRRKGLAHVADIAHIFRVHNLHL
jgi:hypothetical protein